MLDVVIRALAHVLTPLFVVGMTGATVVVAITFVHDVIGFFADEGDAAPRQD